jgi:hypothetical protein
VKSLIWIGGFVGSAVGGYVPELWGADAWSMAGYGCSLLGACVGIWIGWRVQR